MDPTARELQDSGLTALEWLSLSRTGITKLAAIAPATLVGLSVDDNKIVDPAPLAKHTKLGYLNLSINAIVSIHPIVAAPFWAGPCVQANFRENPLDAETLAVDVTALCDGGDAIEFSDQFCGDCLPMP